MPITSLKHKKDSLDKPIATGTYLGVGEDTSPVGLSGISDLSEKTAQAKETKLTAALSGGGQEGPPAGPAPSKGQSGAPQGKPVSVNRAPTTRMGVGPGGPALGYNQAYALLNAPQNIGDIQQAGRTFSNMGTQQQAAFDEASGAPQAFGERERRAIDVGSTPGASQTGMDEARDVLFRQYGGPLAMAQGRERERGQTEATKTGALGELVETGARAFGRSEDRAAVAQLSGETTGMSAQTAQEEAQSGEKAQAQRFAATQGGANAQYAQQLRDSFDYGMEQVEGARGIREAAGEYLGGKEEGLWQGIRQRAGEQRKTMSASQAALARFNQTGDMSDLKGRLHSSILEGRVTPQQAMQAWDGTWDRWTEKARKESGGWMANLVKRIAPMVSVLHYTGQGMLVFTREDMEMLTGLPEFDKIRGRIRNMWDHRSSPRAPGAWLSHIMYYARRTGQRGDQARQFLDLVRYVYGRQQELEPDFSQAMPGRLGGGSPGQWPAGESRIKKAGSGITPGIQSPDEIVAGGTGSSRKQYFRDQLRHIQGNEAGRFSHIRNLYGREGERQPDHSQFLTRPEGVIDDYTAMNEQEQNQLNQMYFLRGGEQDFYQRKEGPDYNIGGIGALEDAYTSWDEAGRARVEEDERAYREQRRLRRSWFRRLLGDATYDRYDIANLGQGTRSRDYKKGPQIIEGQEDEVPGGADDFAAWGLNTPVPLEEQETEGEELVS